LIRTICHGLNSSNDHLALRHPPRAPQNVTNEVMVNADRHTRRDLRLGCNHLMCTLRESSDFPSIMNTLVASMARRIQKLSDNGGIAWPIKSPDLVRRLCRIAMGLESQLLDKTSILTDRSGTCRFSKDLL
jgi:hypothetical protein